MIIDGKGICDYCKRVIKIDEYTQTMDDNPQLMLYCTRCYCNIIRRDHIWNFYSPQNGWKRWRWHEIELKGLLEHRTFDEILSELPTFHHKKCSWCNRLMMSLEIEYPEQIMEYNNDWKMMCWVCNCKQGNRMDHIEALKKMMGCGC